MTVPVATSRAANKGWCRAGRSRGCAARDARPHRQHRPGPVQGLDLRILIGADHDGVLRRCRQVRAHDVADFRFELRVGREREAFGAVRLQAEFAPQDRDRVVADADALRLAQPVRQPPADQCVTPWARSESGGGVTGAARISHTTSSVSTRRGPPGRGASSSPASPHSAYWRRHLITVSSAHPARSAICEPVRPLAASSTIRARSTTRAGRP